MRDPLNIDEATFKKKPPPPEWVTKNKTETW